MGKKSWVYVNQLQTIFSDSCRLSCVGSGNILGIINISKQKSRSLQVYTSVDKKKKKKFL